MNEPVVIYNTNKFPALREYIALIAEDMGLGLYRFEVREYDEQDEEIGDHITAIAVTPMNGYLGFTVHVTDVFWKRSPALQRHMVVHELVHVIDNQRQRLVGGIECAGVFSPREYSLFQMEYIPACEAVTDWVATLLARHMKLPTWE